MSCSNCGVECKYSKCTECHKEYSKKYYEEHKEEIKARSRAYNKATNYRSEKTPEARKRRAVKRKTRRLFSLGKVRCSFPDCNDLATCHHHIKDPKEHIPIIQYDKFKYLCHKHHVEIHQMEGGVNGKINKNN